MQAPKYICRCNIGLLKWKHLNDNALPPRKIIWNVSVYWKPSKCRNGIFSVCQVTDGRARVLQFVSYSVLPSIISIWNAPHFSWYSLPLSCFQSIVTVFSNTCIPLPPLPSAVLLKKWRQTFSNLLRLCRNAFSSSLFSWIPFTCWNFTLGLQLPAIRDCIWYF